MSTVLRNYQYVLLAIIVGLSVLGFAILLPNLQLISLVFRDSSVSLADKLGLLVGLLGSITTNFMLVSALTTVAISLLVGVNVALVLYLYRRKRSGLNKGGVAVSTFGAIVGIFGVGCAACGSLILTGLLSAVGGVGVLALLPFKGQELGIVGVVALLYATYFLVQKIIRPITCEIK